MEHGYTYTVITGHPGEAMKVRTSFYLDETAHIVLVGAGTDRAFLSIDHGDVSVDIGPRVNVKPTDQDVDLIRQLAEKSAALLAEVERLHAEHAADQNAA
jgi:glutamine synthetase